MGAWRQISLFEIAGQFRVEGPRLLCRAPVNSRALESGLAIIGAGAGFETGNPKSLTWFQHFPASRDKPPDCPTWRRFALYWYFPLNTGMDHLDTSLEATFRVDPDSSEPLYTQVEASIQDYVHRFDLKPGAVLPSEREMADLFQVSRLTIRKAIDELSREGRVYRRAGRGTYVSQPKLQQPLLVLNSFTEAILREGHTPGIQLLSMKVQGADSRTSARLKIESDAPVLSIKRLRSVDGLPFSLSTSHLRYDLVHGIN